MRSLWKILTDQTGALTFTPIKRYKPRDGIRAGIVDITFDTSGPTWAVAASDLAPGATLIRSLIPESPVAGIFISAVRVVGDATITLTAWAADGDAGAAVAAGASDLSTQKSRCRYEVS